MKEGQGKISLAASLTVITRDEGGEHPAMAGHTHLECWLSMIPQSSPMPGGRLRPPGAALRHYELQRSRLICVCMHPSVVELT
jgi:hypothetical protein